jgi:hypothetical protein
MKIGASASGAPNSSPANSNNNLVIQPCVLPRR